MITPQNVLRHELIGLYASVEKSCNLFEKDVFGLIVDETRNTVSLNTPNGVKIFEKHGRVFRVIIPDGTVVRIDGDALVYRSKRRK
ncbi:MAG: ribonuclease P protein subunit [Methanocorpusculum sp.]|nr:ribonuclease P protein subunit [Methanocorpusculum sp.]